MDQINTHTFYDLASHLRACFDGATVPLKFWNVNARSAKQLLESVLAGSATYKLDESRVTGTTLLAEIDQVVNLHDHDAEAKLTPAQLEAFNKAWFAFQPAIALELARAPIFYVTSKGVYDTRRLIADAKATYESYGDRLPQETLDDTNEAGKCLAFDLPTAAGFHIARATEAVIKRYMDTYACPAVKDSQRNWGSYIKALTDKGANDKILHHLTQIKDLHRNPVTHPDVTLTMPEAIAL